MWGVASSISDVIEELYEADAPQPIIDKLTKIKDEVDELEDEVDDYKTEKDNLQVEVDDLNEQVYQLQSKTDSEMQGYEPIFYRATGFKDRELMEIISNLLSLNITPDTITKHLQQLNK